MLINLIIRNLRGHAKPDVIALRGFTATATCATGCQSTNAANLQA